MAVRQPSGTVTFVFTDIEGSTRLLEELGTPAYREALGEHRRLVREACARYEGYEVDYEGDAFFYAFASAQTAVSAVGLAMEKLDGGPIRIRVGIHTGEPALDPPKYVGLDVHRAARLMAAAHGGQVVVSASTAALVGTEGLLDLGEHRFKDLAAAERVFQLGAGEFPPLRSLFRSNLPVPATPFLGRELELAEVAGLLAREDVRLLTLTGPGGTGKTRLALQAAAEAADGFPDGVWWVPLAPLRDWRLVLGAIADAVDAKGDLEAHIGERRLLLVLDNLEHVMDAAADVARLTQRCPRLVLLGTSRELLRVAGEHAFRVPELSGPDSSALFVARALAVQGETGSGEEIEELCSQLEHLPLAIELAAARTTHLPPRELLDRLGQRLDVLRGGRDVDARQRTLRATIHWSYELLSDEEAALLARLSAFVGGCTLASAVEVCDADVDTVGSLVDKSLLRRAGDRYSMLETIRAFAAERLAERGDGEAVRERHATHFTALAHAAEPLLRSREQHVWLRRLRDEFPNLRAAIQLLDESGDAEEALELLVALREFWDMDGRFAEPRALVERLLGRGKLTPGIHGRALVLLTLLLLRQGDLSGVVRSSDEAVAACRRAGDGAAGAHALGLAGFALLLLDRPEEGHGLAQEAVDEARRADDLWVEAFATNILACSVWQLGDTERATLLAETARSTFRALGDLRNEMVVLHNLAEFALVNGRLDGVQELLDEALAVVTELDDRDFQAATRLVCARHALLVGAAEVACENLAAALALARSVGDRLLVGECLRFVAGLAAERSDRRAVSLWAASAKLIGQSRGGTPGVQFVDERYLLPLRGRMESLLYETAWKAGDLLSLDEAVDLAAGVLAEIETAGVDAALD
jgi:predicted ATPase/class 3 adenylate cyclase